MQAQVAISDQELQKQGLSAIEELKAIVDNPKWEKYNDKPCLMLKMSIGDRVAARGEIKVNYPMEKIYEFLLEPNSLLELNDQLKHTQKIYDAKAFISKRPPRVVYMQYKGIWPVSDRDFVTINLSESSQNIIYMAAKSINYPYPQKKGVVRGKIAVGGYVLKKIDDNTTHVTYISDTDLCGSIPGMVKNQVSKKQGGVVAKIQETMKKH